MEGFHDVTINANKEPLFSRVNILYNGKGFFKFFKCPSHLEKIWSQKI